MTAKELQDAMDQFSQSTVLVIGDVMIDAYYWGDANRISPEAPVPVVDISKKEMRLGGAANVALNLMTLGAKPVICSVIGNDIKGDEFEGLLKKRSFTNEGIVRSEERCTTVKTRVISDEQHLLRVDEEDKHLLSNTEEGRLIERIQSLLDGGNIDAVLFEDYDKGCITPQLISAVVTHAKSKQIPISVDPKKKQFLDYKRVTLFKPNLKELREGLKVDVDPSDSNSIDAAVSLLESELDNAISLITLSEHGVWIKADGKHHHIAAHKRKILDVSGAGDTVIATATLALVAKLNAPDLAALSNLAGGLVCEHVGVVPIEKETLHAEALKVLCHAS